VGEPTLSVPDSIIPLAGFRRWAVPYGEDTFGRPPYTLVTRGHSWPVGEPMKAKCIIPWNPLGQCFKESPPSPHCDCGIYAHHEIDRGEYYRSSSGAQKSVFGSCIGWGRVYFDNRWWRAEYCKPIAFADPRDTERHMLTKWVYETVDWLEGVAEKYKVPILPRREIEEYTYQYGAVWKVPRLTDDEEEARK
jgi:hypothetical protein